MGHRVVRYKSTDFSEEHIISICRVDLQARPEDIEATRSSETMMDFSQTIAQQSREPQLRYSHNQHSVMKTC